VVDESGNWVSPAIICDPDGSEFPEKCFTRAYQKKTTIYEDKHKRVDTRQTNENGDCISDTECSGSYKKTTKRAGEVYYEIPPYMGIGDCKTFEQGEWEDETEYTYTYTNCNNETSSLTGCSGSSHFDRYEEGGDCADPPSWYECNSTLSLIDGMCKWSGTDDGSSGGGSYNSNCVFGGEQTLYEVTYDPEQENALYITFENPAPPTFYPEDYPSYPDFEECDEDDSSITHDAYFFENPHNTAITTERRVRFRLRHIPSTTCYLKVWMRKVIQPYKWEDCETGFAGDTPRTEPLVVNCEDEPCTNRWSTDGEATFGDLTPYEWTGTESSPCIPDDTVSIIDCNNVVYSDPIELIAAKNTSVSIQYKYSCIPDYEPNWPDENGCQGCKPNGFPIPNPDDCCEYADD